MNFNLANIGILRSKNFTQKKRDLIMGAFTVGVIFIVSLFSSDPVLDFLCRTVIFMLFATAVNIILGSADSDLSDRQHSSVLPHMHMCS